MVSLKQISVDFLTTELDKKFSFSIDLKSGYFIPIPEEINEVELF